MKFRQISTKPLSILANFIQPGSLPNLRPEDLPTFFDDGGNQRFRARRIEELEQEILDLNREIVAQNLIDAEVERVLLASFPEASNE